MALAVVVAALAAIAALASSAHAHTDDGLVEFRINDEPPTWLEKHPTISDAADVSPNFISWWRLGDPPEQKSLPGTSAAALAALVGVVPESLVDGDSAMVVDDGKGNEVKLSRDQVTNGFDNVLAPGSRGVAVLTNDGPTLGATSFFAVPMRATDAPSEWFYVGGYGSVSESATVRLKVDGLVLKVTAMGPETAKAGKPVQFNAVPEGDGSGWSYDWSFDDGHTSAGQAPVHTFAEQGRYAVRVTASSPGGAGISAPWLVTVGAKDGNAEGADNAPGGAGGGGGASHRAPAGSRPGANQSGTGTGQHNAPATGRNRSLQRKDVDSNNPEDPAANDRAATAGGSSERSGSGGGGPGGGSGQGGPGGGRGTGSGQDAATRTAHARGAGANAGLPPRQARSADNEIIDGVLISDGEVYSAQREEAAARAKLRRAQQAARAGEGSASDNWPAWVGGAVLLAALLCAGMAREQIPAARREVWAAPLPPLVSWPGWQELRWPRRARPIAFAIRRLSRS